MFENTPYTKMMKQDLTKTLNRKTQQATYVDNETNEKIRDMKIDFFRTHKRKLGRNDLCPCGSGKKFKKCCGNSITSENLKGEK